MNIHDWKDELEKRADYIIKNKSEIATKINVILKDRFVRKKFRSNKTKT